MSQMLQEISKDISRLLEESGRELQMALTIEVVSKEIIRPSTPTPHHLKAFKLSLIDQYIPAIPVSIVHFYSAKDANIDHIKRSLSHVLTDFYPLAGRIKANKFIECNDEGVTFVETRVVGQLNSEANQLVQLLPSENFYGPEADVLLSIQVNHFECGGVAIAVRMSHKVGDASSLSLFTKHWASVTRGETDSKKSLFVKFDLSSIFPPQDESPRIVTWPIQKLVSKRFVFDARNIAALKAKISDSGKVASVPTRVQAVSALIWGCAMRAGSIQSQSVVAFAVNFRKRMVPPLSDFCFGNVVLSTLIREDADTEDHRDLNCLAGQLQKAVMEVDGNYAAQLQTPDGYFVYYNRLLDAYVKHTRGELELYNITSWCRFPFYENDFGWGEPFWVTYADFYGKNVIVLMDAKCGQGIEAWVTLEEEDMTRFQSDSELIAFTSTSSKLN